MSGECQFAENVLAVLCTSQNYTLPAQLLLKMAKIILCVVALDKAIKNHGMSS